MKEREGTVRIEGWINREEADPKQIPASIRYALLQIENNGNDFLGGSFVFPWYKKFNGQTCFCCLREEFPSSFFSLDLGKLTEEEEMKELHSFAWIDFRIKTIFLRLSGSRSVEIHLGEVFGEEPAYDLWWSQGPKVIRPHPTQRSPSGEWGIYVAPELRRQGIGTALVTAAKIILHDNKGIQRLVFDSFFSKSDYFTQENKLRKFYENLGAQFVDLAGDFEFQRPVVSTAGPYQFK